MLCQELSKEGFGRSSSLAPDSTLSLSEIPMAHDRSVSMRWTTPRRRHGNASACLKRKSHFRHGLFSCQSISSGTMWERSSSRSKSTRSEEHTSELQSRFDLVCRLLLEKKNKRSDNIRVLC